MKKRNILALRATILIVALSFIVVGIIRKEHISVLTKAVKICFECIGIG